MPARLTARGAGSLAGRVVARVRAAVAAARATVPEVAAATEARMKQIVPVDTENLRDRIEALPDGDRYTVGPRGVDYAGYVEYGTSKMRAQPYVRPAAEWARGEFPRRVARAVEAVIDE